MGTTYFDFEPGDWGQSLANVGELLFPCLDAIGARTVLEIGASKGHTTRPLLDWAAGSGARIMAIEPEVKPELQELADEYPALALLRSTSLEVLPEVEIPDAVIVDGDHNYYTVSEELRIIGERAPGERLPLLLFHDVGWPHARRDTYYAPERIPEEHRQPLVNDTGLVPGDPEVDPEGLPFVWAAEHEGGPRNGVLTAIEDFVADREGLRLVTVPVFFGFGIVWHTGAPWAEAVARIVEPWHENPILARAEANRVVHLVAYYTSATQLYRLLQRDEEERNQLFRAMLGSRAFTLAEHLSRFRQGGRPVFSREQVKRALREDGQG